MNKTDLKPGDVVQIAPGGESAFSGCFMIVTEPKGWGAQGFIAMPQERGVMPGRAYFRAPWAAMEFVGRAAFTPSEEEGS